MKALALVWEASMDGVEALARRSAMVWQSAWQSTSRHQMDCLVQAGRGP